MYLSIESNKTMEDIHMRNEIKNAGLKKFIVVLSIILTLVGIIPFDTLNLPQYLGTTTYAATVEEPETETKEEPETEPVVEVETEPTYTIEEMSAVLYAQQASNVRSGPSKDYDVIGGLATNQEVTITGKASTGWYRISYDGGEGFVAGSLLKDTQVVIEVPVQEPVVEQPVVEQPAAPKSRGEMTEAELIQFCLSECINPMMNDFEKAVAINNYLCAIVTYDHTHTHRSTFDALAYGVGVCQGYANAYKKLMDAAGIPTDYVSGQAWSGKEWGRHAWNRSLINGVYYYTDVTWNDNPTAPNRYLLITYEEMSQRHVQQEINRQNRVM